MNVNQVKDVIKKTKCAEFICSAEYCSEPIMSKDSNGNIIDNYILFSRTEDCLLISQPHIVFGIYTDKEKTAYVKEDISNQFQKQMYKESFEDKGLMADSRRTYLSLYPEVRDMFVIEENIDKEKIQRYVEALNCISGKTLFSFYKQLFPDFFEWALKIY